MNEPLLCVICGTRGTDLVTCSACRGVPILKDRFILREVIGRGAAGTTYRADDTETNQVVALKEMPLGHPDPKRLEQLNREARVLRQLEHPSIPEYIAHFTAGVGKQTAFYIAQEFIDGSTLAQEQDEKRHAEADVREIMDEVLEILEYLHRLSPPVIHRDIKPKNLIRRSSTGKMVLIDFGSVRDIVVDPKVGGSTIAGTYGYMAPEQYRGVALAQSDLYSVGVLAVVLLSRRDPIELVGAAHTLDWRASVNASAGLCDLIDSMLSERFEDRIAAASEVRAALRKIARGQDPGLGAAVESEIPTALPAHMDRDLRKRVGAKSKALALLAAFIGGSFGAQYWYLEKYLKGILSFIFFPTGIPMLISLVWFIRHLFMATNEFDAQYNPLLKELQVVGADSIAAQLETLHDLTQQGALTPEEFEREKRRLLGDKTPELADIIQLGNMPLVGQILRSSLEMAGTIGEAVVKGLKDEIKKHNQKK